MSLSPEVTARIKTVEAKLAELDPILQSFCTRWGYTFSSEVGVWPRRRVWVREEIDRTMALTTDLTVPEVMERGFYPEMPWSLYADASLSAGQSTRFLSMDVFRALPFSQLESILDASLEDGRTKLRSITREDIATRGEIVGGASGA